MESHKKIMYEEEKKHFYFDFYPYLTAFILFIPILIFINIYCINRIIIKLPDEQTLALRYIIFLLVWDIIVPIALLLMFISFSGRKRFQLFEDGFVPPKIPKNRRRPKKKNYISVGEIEKMGLIIIKEEIYPINHVFVVLKDGSEFQILERYVKRRGLEELMRFKEMHGIKGDSQKLHS